MAFDEPSANREYFKPKEHQGATAILIEVKRDAPKSPGYKGELKDAVYADLTVFSTTEALDSGEPSKVYRNARLDNALLQRELRDNVGIGNETVRVLGQWSPPSGGNPSWVWRHTDDETRAKVIKYYGDREAALTAAASAEDTPDYLR